MGRRIVLESGNAEFERLFTEVRRSWFRLETLQHYDAPYDREALPAFLRGEPIDMTRHPTWRQMVRDHVAAGRTLARVHVVEEPHTDYMRYELACYPPNVEAGEDVRIIPVRRGDWPEGVPRHDYWLFDDRDLWLMEYDAGGRLLWVELAEDPVEVEPHRRWRDAALDQSIPLADYTAAQSSTS